MKMTPEHESKFRKVLGLLGSDQDGERASAAKIANAYLKQYRMTWADVADAIFHATPEKQEVAVAPQNDSYRSQPERGSFTPVDHTSMANELLSSWTDKISEWEVNFLRSIRNRRELSRKQDACLTKIWERVSGEASVWSG